MSKLENFFFLFASYKKQLMIWLQMMIMKNGKGKSKNNNKEQQKSLEIRDCDIDPDNKRWDDHCLITRSTCFFFVFT